MDLYTPEGENLNGQPWNIYPRPMLVRDSFFCLNGMWDFAESPDAEIPAQFSEQIRVPFPPESLLSGIHRVPDENAYIDQLPIWHPQNLCPYNANMPS